MTETPRKKQADAAKSRGDVKPMSNEETQPLMTTSDVGPRRRAAKEMTPEPAKRAANPSIRQVEEPLQPRDVEPPMEEGELAEKDSYTPPSKPNEAASNEEPKDATRPETKEERRQRRREEQDVANATAEQEAE